MFDPERDVEREGWSTAARLAAIALVTTLCCLALWPSITSYGGAYETEHNCLAIVDGWKHGPPDPGPNGSPAAQAAFDDWENGAGLCHTEARHRLLLSSVGILAVMTGTLIGVVTVRRRRTRNGRPEGRPQETVLVG